MLPVSAVSAYNLETYQWNKPLGSTLNVAVKYNTSNNTYRSAFDTAVSDWNSSQSKINYNLSALNVNASNFVGTETIADQSLYGDTLVSSTNTGTTNFINYFQAKINIGNDAVVTKTNTRRSAAVHELGHTLSLTHTPILTLSVMQPQRDREKVYTPQTDDINGVNARYPF